MNERLNTGSFSRELCPRNNALPFNEKEPNFFLKEVTNLVIKKILEKFF